MYIETECGETDKLIIRKKTNGEILAEHPISSEKGKLIKNRTHTRDRSRGIEELKKSVISSFENEVNASDYVNEICQIYTRYRRDQLLILQNIIKSDPEWTDHALQKCLKEKIYSANDFRDVVIYLKQSTSESPLPIEATTDSHTPTAKIDVTTRSLNTYTSILGGRVQ